MATLEKEEGSYDLDFVHDEIEMWTKDNQRVIFRVNFRNVTEEVKQRMTAHALNRATTLTLKDIEENPAIIFEG